MHYNGHRESTYFIVDTGPDCLTWLGEDGTRAKNLDATITDQEAYTVQWTVVSEPNDPNNPDAVIADPSAEDTNIKISIVSLMALSKPSVLLCHVAFLENRIFASGVLSTAAQYD